MKALKWKKNAGRPNFEKKNHVFAQKLTAMRLTATLTTILLLLGLYPEAMAQPGRHALPTTYLRVEFKDGAVLSGRRLAMTETLLTLDVDRRGKLNIPLDGIREIREITRKQAAGKEFWHHHATANQNQAGFTAFGLRKGAVQYHNFMLGFNQVGVGITDRLSVFAAIELISPIIDNFDGRTAGPGFMVRTQYTHPFSDQKFHAGGGLLFMGLPYSGKPFDVAAPYLTASFGNNNNNISFSAGWAFGKEGGGTPLIYSVSGNLRISRVVILTSENWVWGDFWGNTLLNTLGFRFTGRRAAFTIAAVGSGDRWGYFVAPLPAGSLTLNF